MELNEGFWVAGKEGTVTRMNSGLLRWGDTDGRPTAADDYTGSLYLNTSTNTMSYCTGSAWVDFPVNDHAFEHANGAGDEINVAGLSGELAGLQKVKDHTHQSAGSGVGGTLDHANLTGLTADQHHAQSHTLASHSTKNHSELTGVTADQHHAQSHGQAQHSDIDQSLLTISSPTFAGATINSMPVGDNLDTQIFYSEASVYVTKQNTVNILDLAAERHGACTIYIGSADSEDVYILITIDGTEVHYKEVDFYDSFPLIFTAIFNHSLKVDVENEHETDDGSLYNVRILGNYGV